MSLFKRICSIALAVIMVVTVFTVAVYAGASAATGHTLTVSEASGQPGTDITADISLAGADVGGVQCEISYDKSVVTPKSAALAIDEKYCFVSNIEFDKENGKVFLCIFYSEAIPEGKIASVTFTAAQTSIAAESALTLGNVTLSDLGEKPAPYEDVNAVNGKISVNSPLKIYGKNLSLGADITLQTFADAAIRDVYGYENIYIKFKLGIREANIYPEADLYSGKYLLFKFQNINPYEMGQIITIQLFGTYDGTEYSTPEQEYSVLQYCKNQFSKSSNEKLKRLMADMLNYGAAAQVYQKKFLDNLVNEDADITSYIGTYETKSTRSYTSVTDKNYDPIGEPTCSWYGTSLLLGGKVKMNFYFDVTGSIDNLEVRFSNGTQEFEPVTKEKFVSSGTANRYSVEFDKYGAAFMSQPVYVTIYDDGVRVSNTYRYSVESYAASTTKVGSTKAQELQDLCHAIIKYGDSAKNSQ